MSCFGPVSVPVCPYLVMFLSLFSFIISWFLAPVCPSLSCVYKPQSVQLVLVGSNRYVRVFPTVSSVDVPCVWIVLKIVFAIPRIHRSLPTQSVTEDPTNNSYLRVFPPFFVSRFTQCLFFPLCPHGSPRSSRIPPPPAGAGGQSSRGPY